jgi:hypothetical protein
LQPYFLEGEDYLGAHEALYPHAQRSLLQQILTDLRQELPQVLTGETVRAWLELGDPDLARTHALVIGLDRPDAERKRLYHAETDASALGSHLERLGVRAKHKRVLRGRDATREQIERFFAQQGPRLLQHDQLLIYFAGYGDSDAAGDPRLRLADGAYPLSELKRLCQELDHSPRVTFVLDTSFAGPCESPLSRTYAEPAGPSASPPGEVLLRGQSGWRVLTASRADESAYERLPRQAEGGGVFTGHLLALLDAPGATASKADFEPVLFNVNRDAQRAQGRDRAGGQHPTRAGAPEDLDRPLVIVPAQR